jgi:hypothetical protein
MKTESLGNAILRRINLEYRIKRNTWILCVILNHSYLQLIFLAKSLRIPHRILYLVFISFHLNEVMLLEDITVMSDSLKISFGAVSSAVI